ncbi:MAG: hypothetical protein M1827_007767 [Pycnora praestabilis]|nr:MAG: hypothetical protein M1827_007767 [Pycnora praestabilis]
MSIGERADAPLDDEDINKEPDPKKRKTATEKLLKDAKIRGEVQRLNGPNPCHELSERWKSESDKCRNRDKTCYVDEDDNHYSINSESLAIWHDGTIDGNATVEEPSRRLISALMKKSNARGKKVKNTPETTNKSQSTPTPITLNLGSNGPQFSPSMQHQQNQ